MRSRWAGILFCLFSSLFLSIGIWQAHVQNRAMNAFVPVTATVVSASIKTDSDTDGTTYLPVVKYRYTVNDRAYSGDAVTALKISSSSYKWAASLISRYAPDQKVTAYYDPIRPDRAFLSREVEFAPYLFVLFPMIFFCAGLFAMFPRNTRETPNIRAYFFVILVWNGTGVAAAIHYFALSPEMDLLAKISLCTYFLVGALMAYAAIYHWMKTSFPNFERPSTLTVGIPPMWTKSDRMAAPRTRSL